MVKRVLEKSSKQTRESLNKLLNYPESSAGSLMTPEYVRLREDMTVAQAFEAIRKQGENAETVYTLSLIHIFCRKSSPLPSPQLLAPRSASSGVWAATVSYTHLGQDLKE